MISSPPTSRSRRRGGSSSWTSASPRGGRASAAGNDTEPTVSRVSEPGLVLGTVGYMSPEQVRGLPADARSDLFSLGAVLYEMLTGQRAFRRETAAETLTAILREDPPESSSSSTRLTPAVGAVLRQCLEKDPARRFSSAASLAARLRELLDTPGAGGSEARPAEESHRFGGRAPLRQRRKRRRSGLSQRRAHGAAHRHALAASEASGHGAEHRLPFQGAHGDPLAAGRELDVRAVLTGRLLRNGDRLRVQAELVDVATGFRLWGASTTGPSRTCSRSRTSSRARSASTCASS